MAIHLTEQARQDVTIGKGTIFLDSDTGELNVAGRTTPHIIPGVLYPAYVASGTTTKLLDGTTTHGTGTYNGVAVSTAYGTVQADGRKYYYTNIAGSKPIKDPRIGGHFGSQRHKIKSLQLLEQETATQGNNVYSLDGRKWLRLNATKTPLDFNRADGRSIGTGPSGGVNSYFEIVGYFSDMNLVGFTQNSDRGFNVKVDGGTATAENNSLQPSINSPLGTESNGRFVDAGAVVNLGLNQTLGIHTVRVTPHASGDYVILYGIELIAQDTTSTANRSKIQIPSQNVVSYGKKFAVSAEGSSGHHYDPFNGFTSGSSVTSYIDTATSLGVENWKNSSTYYRPYNGGRVVKWVDSSGVIKTSVTLMPPNAQNVAGSSLSPKANASVANDTYLPTFSGAIDHSLSEVAKTFHFREFGNGSANGSAGATYQDASTLDGNSRDIAYVMDDGLTSLSGSALKTSSEMLYRTGSSSAHYITFIGSGIAKSGGQTGTIAENTPIAQNLPFGTHTLKHSLNGSSTVNGDYTIDGVTVISNITNDHLSLQEISIYQPKKPPIPEDACVIADYMLMADFVGLGASNNTDKRENISKGVRRLSGSRDVLYDNSSFTLDLGVHNPSGFAVNGGSNDYSAQNKISFFGDKVVYMYGDPVTRFLDSACTFSSGTKGTTVDISSTNNNNVGARQFSITDGLRQTTFTADSTGASNSYTTKNGLSALDLATPIHTSFHYQTFESPFLKELVGGDRNMEQTNLVCSPDGKTWDQITRDTSYIGSACVNANTDQGGSIIDEWRGDGGYSDPTNYFNKDWAIAYDRIICLKDGMYEVSVGTFVSNGHMKVWLNYTVQNQIIQGHDNTGNSTVYGSAIHHFKRGDYIAFQTMNSSINYNTVTINRL